jgi:6-pyruvoyltetrahydropterin/6-carboxytetrahydropterin synthase
MMQYITRSVEIDYGHRVMHERFKCYSIHGHRARIELTFAYQQQQEIGYAIDFHEIKRIGGQWLHDYLDHGFIANPEDRLLIEVCEKTQSKLYLMSLNGKAKYCNPTTENLSREIFLAMEILFAAYPELHIHQVRFYETPQCWVDTVAQSITAAEKQHFQQIRGNAIKKYAEEKGVLQYDIRKV